MNRSGAGRVSLLSVVAITLVATATWLAAQIEDGDSPSRDAGVGAEVVSGSAKRHTAAGLSTAGYLDLGPFLILSGAEAVSTSVRSGLSVAQVPTGSVLSLAGSWSLAGPRNRSAFGLQLRHGSVEYFARVTVRPENEQSEPRFEYEDRRAKIVGAGPIGAYLVFRAYTAPPDPRLGGLGAIYSADRAWHPVAIDQRGHLWIDPHPVGDVVAFTTGERIDIAGMETIGQWREGQESLQSLTYCGLEDRCRVYSNAYGTATAPFTGVLECRRDGTRVRARLAGEQWTLELEPVRGAVCPGPDRLTLERGEDLPIASAVWTLRAVDPYGVSIDVVSTRDGHLYVGDAQTTLRCPPCAAER